jgi:hypothetical protein
MAISVRSMGVRTEGPGIAASVAPEERPLDLSKKHSEASQFN